MRKNDRTLCPATTNLTGKIQFLAGHCPLTVLDIRKYGNHGKCKKSIGQEINFDERTNPSGEINDKITVKKIRLKSMGLERLHPKGEI